MLHCHEPLGADQPTFHNELAVTGWAVAPAGIAEIRVEIDGERHSPTTGLESPAVPPEMDGLEGADRAGFELRLDTRGWSRGQRTMVVTALDGLGRETAWRGEVEVLPYEAPPESLPALAKAVEEGVTVMWCDAPPLDGSATLGGEITVSGWVHCAAGVEGVYLTVDGRRRYGIAHGFWRRDVSETINSQLSGHGAVISGFTLRMATHSWGPGRHHLTVVAVGRDGRAVGQGGSVTLDSRADPAGGRPEREAKRLVPRDPARHSPSQDGDGRRESIERFVPEEASGELIEAEHQGRYRWAAALAAGSDVLDAGCGVGYGTAVLVRAGARRAVGLDVGPEAVLDARARAGDVAEFVLGDLQELPFPDASFDLITCFEAIEHVQDAERALDELRRVLRDDGTLLISSPNRGVYLPGNPWHVHEFTPQELREALHRRFSHVELYRQHSQLASLICDDEGFELGDADRELGAEVRKMRGFELGEEVYTLAAASNGQLRDLPAIATFGPFFDVKDWWAQAAAFEEQRMLIDSTEAATRAEVTIAVASQDRAIRLLDKAERRAVEAERRLAEAHSSPSWRLTRPLRAVEAALDRLRGGRTGGARGR